MKDGQSGLLPELPTCAGLFGRPQSSSLPAPSCIIDGYLQKAVLWPALTLLHLPCLKVTAKASFCLFSVWGSPLSAPSPRLLLPWPALLLLPPPTFNPRAWLLQRIGGQSSRERIRATCIFTPLEIRETRSLCKHCQVMSKTTVFSEFFLSWHHH